MIVSCPSCKTKYQYDEARFGESPSKKLKCTKCATVFEVTKPLLSQEEGPHTAVIASGRADRATQELEGEKSPVYEEDSNLPQLAPLSTNRRYSLAVIMGANAGQIYTVTKPRTVLGRGTESDVQLHDSEVSRRHAMLEIKGDAATVSDLGSTNGTYVDGVRVRSKDIEAHQEFALGTTTLMFIVTEMNEGA